MAPVKFDDIPKVSKSILDDDYQLSGHQFVAKQKTNFDGAVSTLTVDYLTGPEVKVMTPAKLSFKFPTPFGIKGLPIDKFEMDKAGKFKLEMSMAEAIHKVPGLVLDGKTDCKDLAKATKGLTYTGMKDTFIKVETKPLSPMDFSLEVTRALGNATLGAKVANGIAGLKTPDLGARFALGPYFASILCKDKFKVYTANLSYTASKELKLACTYVQGGKNTGTCSAGLAYAIAAGTSIKAKVAQDMTVSASVKHEIAKGMTVIAGAKYAKDVSYGVKLSLD